MSLVVQNIWYIVKILLKTETFTCIIINNTMNHEGRSESFMPLQHVQPLTYVSHKPIQGILHFSFDCNPGVGVSYGQ